MSVKKVLVTGGAGFLGKYVQSRLEEYGIEPVIYDVAEDITHDICDRQNLLWFAEEHNPDAIIHLAGLLGTHELWDTIGDAIDVNIRGAVNVAQAAEKIDAKLVSIEQPHIWYNVYEATKFAAKRILTGMAYDGDLRVDFVTAHNAYGPGQAHGEGHPQKIIPTFATHAWANEPIPVWGDGDQKVNLVFAGDVADMLVHRAITPWGESATTFNAGSDRLFTVNDIAQAVNDYCDSTADVDYRPMRRGEQNIPYPVPDETYPYEMRWESLHATIDSYKP